MRRLIKVSNEDQILPCYRNTPIEQLFKYHNFGYPFEKHTKAELLVGMCMDNRKQLSIPGNFAYIIRSGGGNLRNSEFKVSYAVAIGGVNCIALIGHNNCGMVNIISKKDSFIEGLVKNAGWDARQAEAHFMSLAPMFEIEDEVEFLLSETKRLRERYPKVMVAPLFYMVEENLLYLIDEEDTNR